MSYRDDWNVRYAIGLSTIVLRHAVHAGLSPKEAIEATALFDKIFERSDGMADLVDHLTSFLTEDEYGDVPSWYNISPPPGHAPGK